MSAPAELLHFDCPRCATAVDERLYGPCRACRDELRALGGPGRGEATGERFEPRPNVTPNQVATKD